MKRREYPFRHSLRQSTETIECWEEEAIINLGKKFRYKIKLFPRKEGTNGRDTWVLDDQKKKLKKKKMMIHWFKQLRSAFGVAFLWLVCLIYFTQVSCNLCISLLFPVIQSENGDWSLVVDCRKAENLLLRCRSNHQIVIYAIRDLEPSDTWLDQHFYYVFQ